MNEPYTVAICVARPCGGARREGSHAELSAWMDQHVIDHPHSPEWPVSFRLEYPSMSAHGVDYRTPVNVELSTVPTGTIA